MQSNETKTTLKTVVLGILFLLLAGAMSMAQQQINLTAAPTSLTLPDGSTVPMWGYACGTVVSGSTATCTALNPSAAGGWSPVVITVPTGQGLTINLTNNLLFQPPTPTGGTAPPPNAVPTSVVIVGQVGGGLGSSPTYAASPNHATQTSTWPIASTGPTAPTFTPPPQGPRVQSFATEVAAVAPGSATTPTALTWNSLRPGTYLLESGTHPSIQVPMGLYGILVVTAAPTPGTAGTAYPAAGTTTAVNYNAEVPLEFSEIDPVQNNAVNTAVNTAGFSETMVWSGQPNGCGNPSSPTYHQCYPPAVNYTPLYYLINGVAFNRTNAAASLFAATPANSVTGNVLVRLVNAGLRMHVPSIVGSQTAGFDGTGAPATVTGFSIIAEDGNVAPRIPKVQSDIFMAAGKTFDVMINVPTGASALPVFDRELSLSGNASERDAGMLAYISVNGAGLPSGAANAIAAVQNITYNSLLAGQAFTVSDPSKGVISVDTNVYGVQLLTQAAAGTVALNANGTFTYTPAATNTTASADSFTYCANGSVTAATTTTAASCSSGLIATVSLTAAALESSSGITCAIPGPPTYTANTATYLSIKPPGVLSFCKDAMGYPLSIVPGSVTATGFTLQMDYATGGFNALVPGAGPYSFTFQPQNSQKVAGTQQTVTLNFPQPSNLAVVVKDPQGNILSDYRWIIEEDKTFYVNPNCTTNTSTPPPGCPQPTATTVPPTFGVNFHTSHMEYVAQGCVGTVACEAGQTVFDSNPSSPTFGQHVPAVCDVGNGVCDTTAAQQTAVDPSRVVLDPGCGFGGKTCANGAAPYPKRYYISVLPGDAANPFSGIGSGHGMGGAPISWNASTNSWNAVTVLVEPTPLQPGKLSVQIFEDDFPLNGEQDAGGGIDVIATNEPGLGGFNIVLWDAYGQFGDVTGQMTYDMFNQPLSNSLAGTIDPATGLDACPISKTPLVGGSGATDPTATGITGMIVTCPKYESDGKTMSPLAGEAVIANLMPGQFNVQAYPGADRIARGEEWLQTNTLDGQHPHDSFVKVGEPAYFQEYGPAGFHVSIGFANPAIINARYKGVCGGTDANLTAANCTNTVKGHVTTERMSRTPDQRLYSSGTHDSFYWTQCFVSLGDPDGEDFMFTKCDANGNFTFAGVPTGSWRMSIFDQWNDILMDGLSTPVNVANGNNQIVDIGDIPEQQWQANVYTRTFVDDNKDGVYESGELGIPFLNTTVRYRDGSRANLLATDFDGVANFNETFPLFSWYVVESDITRYKTTGIHTVYDAGGPADGTAACGTSNDRPCGSSTAYKFLANTYESVPLPAGLTVPGAVYCTAADCAGSSISTTAANSASGTGQTNSTGRIDPGWVAAEGWQGFSGQNNFIEFGKTPYVPGENGGIHGHVVYASTRPFDDPTMNVQQPWEPLVPRVKINLYKEDSAADGVTPTLTLVDTTQTSSWDDWAQGFRSDGIPNMNCPGQGTASGANADLFFFSLYNQPNYLDLYNYYYNGSALHTLPNNSQYKCYDGMHNWNQLQPAAYDGMYSFPSVTGIDPKTGKPTGTNCTACTTDPDSTDPYRFGTPMLPPGKYVVEVVLPPGYELVKEEDKNILIGDNFIAPVTQEFGGLGNVFIMPDQASVASAYDPTGSGYNANNAQNPTQSLGANPNNQIVPGFAPEPVWPCVGEARVVPDYISLFPQSAEVSPFAGATRHLCDRKEVTLADQMGAIAKFYIYTSTHVASKFTGIITDDFTSEFDPFAPTFGEKFSPPFMPVSIRDWAGNEIERVYSDSWGVFNGLTYSTWEVNPPNPTGYSPTMMVTCMNDKGPIPGPNGTMITDPLFNPLYSQFCYENPFMPGATDYMDTPVVPTAGFVGAGYNNPDCSYPDATPAVASVAGDVAGPWVSAPGHTLTINALGDQQVINYGYSGPSATQAPFNQKTVNRHYGFGARCTSPAGGSATCNTLSSVTIGGVPATITNWSDTSITIAAPTGVPACAVQQQAQYGGSLAQCGELVITAGNGKQSVDTVTVTIGGKTPTVLAGNQTIQSAIDAAAPGDMIIVPPGTYRELLLMWKPVRLQGVGAASSILDASTHPAGKLDDWRRRVNCLFGLALNGQASTGNVQFDSTGNAIAGSGGSNPYDPSGAFSCPGTGWNYFSGGPNYPSMAVDRIPLEGILGWDATVNGNLAEQLQEPSIMGAYEGAGITVVSKGVNIPAGAADVFGSGAEAGFPTGTTLLTAGDCTTGAGGTNPYPSNFQCNPSSIDGLGITDASQGGGGIFVHGWGHNLQIANNRVFNNSGTLSGGMSIGQGEFPEAYLNGDAGTIPPGSCNSGTGLPINTQLPYCLDLNVNIHHNSITANSSTGDELFTGTPAGAGGVSICTGADYYKFNYNWVCGNMSTGDGGGLGHLGFSYNGDIEHNSFLFNQATNPSIQSNGGGVIVMGAAPDGQATVNGTLTECGSVTDNDCVPGLSDGVGPGLVINANLFVGNSADAGSGGGLRLQAVNGTDVPRFPSQPNLWYSVNVTNNIITNNVAGWDGAGISLEDALAVNLVNNTIVSNDTTASSGVLFNTLGAPLASSQSPAPTCISQNGGTMSCPQPAGLVTMQNSPQLVSSFQYGLNANGQPNLPPGTPVAITCPAGHYAPGSNASNGTCTRISYPVLQNNIFWQNRTFDIGVGALGTGTQNQQNVVTLYNAFSNTQAASQASTGACPSGSSYWDIGVRNDTGPGNHSSGFTLNPQYSVLTSTSGYSSTNLGTNPLAVSQYCNGSRVPPENGGLGYQVPAGIADAIVPNPIFSLTPTATVDEGNNWVNISWGPLSLNNPVTLATLGNYTLQSTSPDIDYVPISGGTYSTATVPTQATDFFGNPRPDPANPDAFDIGAVEYQKPPSPHAFVLPTSLSFTASRIGTTTAPQSVTLTNDGNAALTGISITITGPFSQPTGTAGGTCSTVIVGGVLAAGGSCTIGVVFSPTVPGNVTGALTISATNSAVIGSPVTLTGTTPAVEIVGGPLAYGNQAIDSSSAPKTLTLYNASTTTLTVNSLVFSSTAFSRPATAPGSCPITASFTVAAGTNCTINVVFAPRTLGAINATLTVNASAPVSGSPVALSGTGVVPSLSLLDNFNRATANNLNTGALPGIAWIQPTSALLGGAGAIQVLDVTSGNTSTGVAYASLAGWAYWNGTNVFGTPAFGPKQAASFTFVNTPQSGTTLILKASGTLTSLTSYPNYISVVYTAGASGTITVLTTTNSTTITNAGTITGFTPFAAGNTISAMVDATGTVWVWRTAGTTNTLLGTITIPGSNPLWTSGGGRIGMVLPTPIINLSLFHTEVDNFSGGNVQ